MQLTLSAITPADAPFLLSVYAATRADELALTNWSDNQKKMFLQMQFDAQQRHYRSRYPNGSFSVVKAGDEAIGRHYVAELADEIRIIDITILPRYRNRGFGAELVHNVLQSGSDKNKPVQIYVENFNPSAKLFSRLGFKPVAEEGIHVLWRRECARQAV